MKHAKVDLRGDFNPFEELFFTLLLFLSYKMVYAQGASITGVVLDQQLKKPIRYASVSVSRAGDTVIVAGALSKADGSFEFTHLAEGDYVIKVASIGYHSNVSAIKLLSNSAVMDAGAIFLTPSQQMLKEVQVTGRRANALHKIDKKTFRADQFETARGGTAIDVLKNLPSVTVNGEGDINFRGTAGFLVLVNGKPVLTDYKNVLNQIPANSLQNIELITSPSAKFDPDGKAGIINIITTTNIHDGTSVTANLQGGLPSTGDHGNLKKPQRFGGDITLNFRKGKWDFSASGNYLRADVAGFREGDVYTINSVNNSITRFPSAGERSFIKYNYAGRLSMNYSANPNNSFSAGLFASHRFQSRLADLLYNNSTTDLTTGALLKILRYFNSNLQSKEGNFSLANVDYAHIFSNKSTLTASALFENADLYGNTRNRNLHYPDVADTIQYVFNPYRNPITGYRFKIDYAANIGKGKLESGAQFRYDFQEGRFEYFVTPVVSQPDVARFRGNSKSKNRISSLYTQYSGGGQKLAYNIGLRYEYAARTVNLSYDSTPHILNLSNLFPSASFQYSSDHGWQFKGGFSKRVQRTTNFELNPIPEREHSETLEQGDPDLLPEFVNLFETGLVKTFSSGSFFTTLYYQKVKNPIQRVNSVYADSILNRVFTNADAARSIGLEIGTNLQPAKWWNVYIGSNIYNYRIKGTLKIVGASSYVSSGSWAYSINVNSNFKLNATWNLQANVNYLSRRPTAQGEDSKFLVPNTSLKKSFMKGRFAATLQWQNMDLGMKQSNRQRITTRGPDFYTTTNYIYETDVIMLNLSFNLNRLTVKSKLPNSEFGEKEF